MKVFTTLALLSAAAVFSGWNAAYAQNPSRTPPPSTLDKVADDLYVIRGEGGNTTIYLTDDGVVLVDPKYDRNHDDVAAKIASLTDKPVRYVINTHAHADHTGGNALFAPALVVGHRMIREQMIAAKQAGAPQLTFDDRMSIHLGGKEVVAVHLGPCHTSGDTFVYFPAEKVLATGDCFNTGNGEGVNLTGSPTFSFFMDYRNGGTIFGKMKAGDAALQFDVSTVVPGHGPLTDRAGLSRWRAEIDRINARVRMMIDAGGTKDEIAEMLVKEFGWEKNGFTMRGSLDGIIAELKQR